MCVSEMSEMSGCKLKELWQGACQLCMFSTCCSWLQVYVKEKIYKRHSTPMQIKKMYDSHSGWEGLVRCPANLDNWHSNGSCAWQLPQCTESPPAVILQVHRSTPVADST